MHPTSPATLKEIDFVVYTVIEIKRPVHGHDRLSERREDTLDFAYNASLAAVNIVKIMEKESDEPQSICRTKSQLVNAYFAKRFFAGYRIEPDPTLNDGLFKELFGYMAKTG